MSGRFFEALGWVILGIIVGIATTEVYPYMELWHLLSTP